MMTAAGAPSSLPPSGRPLRAAEHEIIRDARVGRLATVDRWHRPTIVPFCFALIGTHDPVVVSVLDEKRKRVADRALARVRNIDANPEVAFIVDHYEEDWSRLAFVQVRGRATLLVPGTGRHPGAIAALREKYPQYREMTIETRPVMMIADLRASSWSAADPSALSG